MMVHPNWIRDKKLPHNVVRCPVCGTLRTHRVTAWWFDEKRETWRCRANVCGLDYRERRNT